MTEPPIAHLLEEMQDVCQKLSIMLGRIPHGLFLVNVLHLHQSMIFKSTKQHPIKVGAGLPVGGSIKQHLCLYHLCPNEVSKP